MVPSPTPGRPLPPGGDSSWCHSRAVTYGNGQKSSPSPGMSPRARHYYRCSSLLHAAATNTIASTPPTHPKRLKISPSGARGTRLYQCSFTRSTAATTRRLLMDRVSYRVRRPHARADRVVRSVQRPRRPLRMSPGTTPSRLSTPITLPIVASITATRADSISRQLLVDGPHPMLQLADSRVAPGCPQGRRAHSLSAVPGRERISWGGYLSWMR